MPRSALPAAAAALAACLAVGAAGPAAAQDRLGWLDLLSPEPIAMRLLQIGVAALRTQVDVQYDAMSVDLRAGMVALTGVRLAPPAPWHDGADCRMTGDRAVFSLGSPFAFDRVTLRLDVTGVVVAPACLEPSMRAALPAVAAAGLRLDRAYADLRYDVASGAADLALHATAPGLAVVDAAAHLPYAALREVRGQRDPAPAIRFRDATVAVEDLGLLPSLQAMLPPQLRDPVAAAALIKSELRAELERANARGTEGTPADRRLTPPQEAFVASAADQAARVLRGGGRVVLALRAPDGGAETLDLDRIEEDPREAFRVLNPVFAAAPPSRARLVPQALLDRVAADPSAAGDDDRRRVGLALVTGAGLPRAPAEGRPILEPLAEAGDTQSAMALARAFAAAEPGFAYRMALKAAAAREPGALALADRIEAGLALAAILEAQDSAATPDAAAAASLQALRAAALARLTGVGTTRSYAQAWVHASLGAAAGDAASEAMRDEIEARIEALGPEAAALWAARTAPLSEAMLAFWLSERLAERFAAE